MDNVSQSLYNLYSRLQSDVKRFEEEINKGKSSSILLNGLNDNRIKLGLIGHYSTGKTTLLNRFFDGYAGAVSSVPETACLTVHRLDTFQGITIKFKSQFTVEDSKEEDFRKFLEGNKLEKYVQQVGNNVWKSCQDEEVSPDYKVLDVKRFLENVNKHMNIIDKIYWCHKKSKNDNYNILDFLEIYDLPGVGGTEVHEEIIKQIIETEAFDIIIYLIDPSQGIPKDSDINTLKELSGAIEKGNSEVMFYWAYEKPIDNLDLEKSLESITEAIEGKLVNKFFKKASLLDLTGEKDDIEVPQNVFAKNVLSVYFQKAGFEYLKSQDDFWNREKENMPSLKLQPILETIDNKSRKGAVSRKEAEKIFCDMLELDFDISKKNIWESKQTKAILEILKKLPEELLNSILNRNPIEDVSNSTNSYEFDLPEEDSRILEIETEKEIIIKTCQSMMDFICHGIPSTIDINKIRKPFADKYEKSKDWKLLLKRISHYKIEKNYASVRQFHLANVGKEIYRDIKNGVNAIDKILKSEDIKILTPKADSYKESTSNFSSVNANDSAIAVIPAADLEVLRASDNLPSVDLMKDMREYIGSSLLSMKNSISRAGDAVDESSNLLKESVENTKKTDGTLDAFGM